VTPCISTAIAATVKRSRRAARSSSRGGGPDRSDGTRSAGDACLSAGRQAVPKGRRGSADCCSTKSRVRVDYIVDAVTIAPVDLTPERSGIVEVPGTSQTPATSQDDTARALLHLQVHEPAGVGQAGRRNEQRGARLGTNPDQRASPTHPSPPDNTGTVDNGVARLSESSAEVLDEREHAVLVGEI
jgi:hypothetical protein